MSDRTDEEIEFSIKLLLVAVVGIILIVALAGKGQSNDCIAYWDGTKYTCEP
jgi:hypothetical protein